VKFCRFQREGPPQYGLIRGGSVYPLSGPAWDGGEVNGQPVAIEDVTFAAPCQPTKIVLVGQNYRKHAEELGKPVPEEPLIFLKPPSAVIGPGAAILYPPDSQLVHHEAELAAVVGRRLHYATEAEVVKGIFGLMCFNDVTARDLQRKEVQFTRAKSFDTFACMGPWIETELSSLDLRIQCRVNGETRQDSRTSDMVFPLVPLIAFMSRVMTLLPGDVVSTGTPAGVGPLEAGDVVEVEVEGIGILANPVLRAS
jgi:2-keto-4-pentenoate hydratase/2-oxohepta-3-ene-1,7-dioic acid hydratase in catechol pathway